MEFPEQIQTFRLHDVFGEWTFKGKEYRSAQYIKLGSRMELYIRTIGQPSGELDYEIQFRDSYISGIDTLEEALQIAEEIIVENNNFM